MLCGVYNIWLTLLAVYPLIGFLRACIGFNVLHDASHGTYSDNKRLNETMAFLGGDFNGGSEFMWDIQHNKLHHPFTNIEGYDGDIAKYPILRFNPQHKRLWFHRHQWWYSFFLYSVTTLYWVYDDLRKFITKEAYPAAMNREMNMKPKERWKFIGGKVLNCVVYLLIPMYFIGWWQALLGTFILHVVFGLTLALVFQIAHVVEDIAFEEPPQEGEKMDEWMKHQVTHTRNFGMHKKVLSWLVGGLNFQIEHHLFFNDISHVHYPAISKIVQDVCREFNVPYQSFPSFRKGVASHVAHLYEMGLPTS